MPTLGGVRLVGPGPAAAAVRRVGEGLSALVPRRLRRIAEKMERRRGRPWGHFAAAAFLAASALYGMIAGGHVPRLAEAALAAAGLGIETVEITGERETSKLAILEQLETGGRALPTFDAAGARERLMALPWVADAAVRKVYPDRLEIAVTERAAFALWQHDGAIQLIDYEGTPIVPFEEGRFAQLPLVVGEGANRRAAEFLAELASYPELASRARAAILVAGRRWDLVLDDGMVVKLPEAGAADAIGDILRLDEQHGLLSRDISAVDLRLPDRVTVHLPEEAKGTPTSLTGARP